MDDLDDDDVALSGVIAGGKDATQHASTSAAASSSSSAHRYLYTQEIGQMVRRGREMQPKGISGC